MTAGLSLLNPDFVATLGTAERLRLLGRADVEIAGCARGWYVVIGRTRVEGRDFADVVDHAVGLLALDRELWPRPTLAAR